MTIAAIEKFMFAETQYVHRCIIHRLGINSTIITRMPSLGDLPPELLAHILSFVPAHVPVKHHGCGLSVTNNERFVQESARRFNTSAAAPFVQKWRLRAVSRAFHCAWHTKRAWRGTRWHLALRRADYGQFGPEPSPAAEWTALLQHIAHLLPDGFLDTIECASRPQFLKSSVDAALAEVRSFGAHVNVETLDVRPLPDGPFTTHLLHEAHYINLSGRVSYSRVRKENRTF